MDHVKSERGNNKIIHEGYIYVKQKNLARGVISYECELRKRGKHNSGECKAKIKVMNGEVVGRTNQHTHAAVAGRPETLHVRDTMKRRALETMEPPQQILATCLQEISEASATQLPPFRTIRRAIRRTKQQANNPLPLPPTVNDLHIPEIYQRTTTNEQFLLYDNEDADVARMLIFATQQDLHLLARSKHWFIDGTFKIVPGLFFQLYTIHALHNSQIIPCVYALLPNKQEATYTSLFQILKNSQNELNPESILADFEVAALNALGAVFPDVVIQGCFFHLSQCVYRKVQNAGLQGQYNRDDALSLAARMIPAIAFVPINDVTDSFELLQEAQPEELQPIMDYFEDTFIGRPGRRNRRGPVFPLPLWNMVDRVHAGLPRTNNNIEGWHRHMDASVGCHHPSIWTFLDVLKKEQALNRINILQIIAGEGPPPQRRIYRNITQRLETLVAAYDNRPRLEFLRSVAHNLHM